MISTIIIVSLALCWLARETDYMRVRLLAIELIAEHSHYTMRTHDTKILKDAFRVYRNPYLKVKLS